MYSFVDTNEVSGSAFLPSEALKINGEYIENIVPGYRTLNVKGREALSPEIETYSTGSADGEKRKSKRYPPRYILITYQLIAKTCEEFREAYNKLGGVLNVEDAELIFNDEQDKFFIGTPYVMGDVEPGRNAVVGEFEIMCADPFKYSVQEYEAEAQAGAGSVLIDYKGTYKAYPTLVSEFYNETDVAEDGETAGTLTGNGDCGYVAFFTEDEKIIQLGDPEETDGSNDAARSQTMMNQTFKTETAWGTTAQNLWSVNNGVLPEGVAQVGGVAMGVAGYVDADEGQTTTGTLIKIRTSTGSPLLTYAVTAKTSDRTASSVKVTASITAELTASASGIGTKRELKASLYIGGAWHDVIIKKSSVHWERRKSYTTNLTVTVSGLTSATEKLTGIKFKVDRTDSLGQAGILAESKCNDLVIRAYVAPEVGTHYLFCNNHGADNGGWHGASITRQIGADAAGEVGAANFTFTYAQQMCIGNTEAGANQRGGFHCHLADASGNIVAGVRIVKTQTGSRQASMMLFVNGQKVYQAGIDLSYYNKNFGASALAANTTTIRKIGEKVDFAVGTYRHTFTDEAIAETKVTQVTFAFERYKETAILTHNGLFSAKFVKNNCSTWREVPNKFSASDVLEANCRTGEILLNGISSPDLGALGNEWESFFLRPGFNQIGYSYSSWITDAYAPTIKVKYRETFL